MSQEEVNRKLSVILSTDVVGYSRLMEENEIPTEPRAIMEDLVCLL